MGNQRSANCRWVQRRGYQPYNYPGAYQLELQQTAVWTDSTGDSNGLGIAGLSVSLDAADEASPLYRIVSNTGHAVVVQSSDDLSVYADSELQGVHRFSALQVTGGASVSFGEDRVHLTGEQPLTVFRGFLFEGTRIFCTDIDHDSASDSAWKNRAVQDAGRIGESDNHRW